MTVIYRRNLPHIHPPGATFFVTFRLAGSLPQEVLERLKEEREEEERQLKERLQGAALRREQYQLQKKFFGRYDDWLDRMAYGPAWLREPALAEMVAREIRQLDGVHCDVLAYCIMPNHVHLLLDFQRFTKGDTRGHPSVLSRVLHLLKGRTARYANQFLGRSGAFWQQESYDHVVRDGKELERIVRYILNNPVKAGLVGDWQDWAYTYVIKEFVLG